MELNNSFDPELFKNVLWLLMTKRVECDEQGKWVKLKLDEIQREGLDSGCYEICKGDVCAKVTVYYPVDGDWLKSLLSKLLK